jgi:hypothetical protein
MQEQSESKRSKGSAHLQSLDNNTQLRQIFEMLGCGHWLFAGAVSRRWRDLYREVCANLNKSKPRYQSPAWIYDEFKRQPVFVRMLGPAITIYQSSFASLSKLQWAHAYDLQLVSNAALQKAAGRFTDKRTLLWAKHNGLPWTADICEGAAVQGRTDMLLWLHEEQGCPWDELKTFVAAAVSSNLDTLNWLCKGEYAEERFKDLLYDDSVWADVYVKDARVLAWLWLHELLNRDIAHNLCINAANMGDITSVAYLLDVFPGLGPNAGDWAVRSSNVSLVKLVKSRGFDIGSVYSAVSSGSIQMLAYLQSIGHGDWSQLSLNEYLDLAGKYGHLELTKWFRAQGAEWPAKLWSSPTYMHTTYCWQLPTLQYAIENECAWRDWPSRVCTDLVANMYTEEVEWGHANGCPCGELCSIKQSTRRS